uniref:Uncharacterized protein n=1 Tax=Chlorobium phaeobacteroides (strain BS1) TaxID=331678 RepID=B3EJ89_CHLPB
MTVCGFDIFASSAGRNFFPGQLHMNKNRSEMEKKYEIGNDHFREKVIAAIFFGFRNKKEPVSVTVHPELMKRIRKEFKNKVVSPVNVGDTEMFFGLPVIEDATKDKDFISVS